MFEPQTTTSWRPTSPPASLAGISRKLMAIDRGDEVSPRGLAREIGHQIANDLPSNAHPVSRGSRHNQGGAGIWSVSMASSFFLSAQQVPENEARPRTGGTALGGPRRTRPRIRELSPSVTLPLELRGLDAVHLVT
jgi:hypothetical protein